MALVDYSRAAAPDHDGPRALDGASTDVAVEAAGLWLRVDRREVLDDVSLRVRRGEVVVVLGRPGAGCSTLLRSLAGLDHRTVGHLRVLPHAGLLPQRLPHRPWATVRRTVGERARADGSTREVTPDEVADALDRVGMGGEQRRRIRTLTLGERRRIALARAIVGRPSVLLLDGPTDGLGTVEAAQVRAALQAVLAEDRPAVVLATADVDEALLLGDRILVLERGRVVLDRSTALDAPRLRAAPRFAALRAEVLAALHVDEVAEGDRR